VNFLIKQLCSCHVIFALIFTLFGRCRLLFLFLTSCGCLLCLFLFPLFCFLCFFLFQVDIELVVWDVEAHFTEDVAISDFIRVFTVLGEFERDLVFAVGAGQGYVLILDAKGSLAVDRELKFIVTQLVAAPVPALG